MQAAWFRLSERRDLRRLPVDLRLWPPRLAHVAQCQGCLVALDGAVAPRRRRPRRCHPQPSTGVGGVGSPFEFHRPTGRLHELQDPPPSGQPRRPRHLPVVWQDGHIHGGSCIQPDVQDPRRPGRRCRCRGVSAPRNSAGHVHQLQEHHQHHPQAAAVRYRPDRQVVPQRDNAGQLRVSHPRVRADGTRVLRAPRRGSAVVRVLG